MKYVFQVRIARIFNTYGPRMCLDDGRVVSNFVAQVAPSISIIMFCVVVGFIQYTIMVMIFYLKLLFLIGVLAWCRH